MRTVLIVLWMLLGSITSAAAQVSVGIGLPGVNIGFNLPMYPQLVPVPGYPVYYAPQVNSNYFFYDGMYWVYQGDDWYTSSWYNGPWEVVGSEVVPLFILRVPVRYYRRPPAYFRGWRSDAPPRWGEHWGDSWAQRRSGWDSWNRSSVPAPAPLPVYQRQYSGDRYPRVEQQQALQSRNYRYQPRDAVAQQHYQAPRAQSAPAPSPQPTRRMQNAPAPAPQAVQRAPQPQERNSPQHEQRAANPSPSYPQGAQPAPRGQPPQRAAGDAQRPAIAQAPVQQLDRPVQSQRQPTQAPQHEQQAPRAHEQDKGAQGSVPAQEPKQNREKGRDQGEPRGSEGKN